LRIRLEYYQLKLENLTFKNITIISKTINIININNLIFNDQLRSKMYIRIRVILLKFNIKSN